VLFRSLNAWTLLYVLMRGTGQPQWEEQMLALIQNAYAAPTTFNKDERVSMLRALEGAHWMDDEWRVWTTRLSELLIAHRDDPKCRRRPYSYPMAKRSL